MKVIVTIFALLVTAAQASYYPCHSGYNPFAALAALGLYNPHVLPAPQVPYSGTYSYHDGQRPTVVQANNDGYKFPRAINSVHPWNPWVAPVAAPAPVPTAALITAPAVTPTAVYNYYGYPGHPYHYSVPQKTVVQANHGSYDPWKYGYTGHPYHYSIPQKTIIQANLGSHDPWNYGSFYGTGIYGFKYNNYAPAAVPVLRIQ